MTTDLDPTTTAPAETEQERAAREAAALREHRQGWAFLISIFVGGAVLVALASFA